MQKKHDAQKITIRLGKTLLEALRTHAQQSRRSLNGEIEWRLAQSVKESKRAQNV